MGKKPTRWSNGAGLYGQQHRNNRPGFQSLVKKLEQIFQSRFFFWVQRFSQNFEGPGTWWYGKALCCDVSSREVVLWGTLYRLLEGCEWKQFGAICLEPQLWPDGVNTSTNKHRPSKRRTNQYTTSRIPSALQVHHPKFQSPILRPGETYKHHSWHVFKAEDLVFLSGHVVHWHGVYDCDWLYMIQIWS